MGTSAEAGQPSPAEGSPPGAAVYAAFDLETTGLVPGVHRIVEVGAVRFTRERVLGRFVSFVDPGVPMPEEARRVNGITDEMLRGQPPLSDVLPRFLAFLGDAYPVAHNAPFDAAFLRAACEELHLPLPATPLLDTCILAMAALPRRRSYGLQMLCAGLGLLEPLRQSARSGACPPEDEETAAHRAAGDAEACRRLFLLCEEELARGGACSPVEIAALCGMEAGLAEARPPGASRIAELARAVRSGESVEISYVSETGERTVRLITPLALSAAGGGLVVEAFCHLRGSERTFRLARIQEVRRAVQLKGSRPYA